MQHRRHKSCFISTFFTLSWPEEIRIFLPFICLWKQPSTISTKQPSIRQADTSVLAVSAVAWLFPFQVSHSNAENSPNPVKYVCGVRSSVRSEGGWSCILCRQRKLMNPFYPILGLFVSVDWAAPSICWLRQPVACSAAGTFLLVPVRLRAWTWCKCQIGGGGQLKLRKNHD